jgi:hypothetical protein
MSRGKVSSRSVRAAGHTGEMAKLILCSNVFRQPWNHGDYGVQLAEGASELLHGVGSDWEVFAHYKELIRTELSLDAQADDETVFKGMLGVASFQHVPDAVWL